jgi:hypothetical protein
MEIPSNADIVEWLMQAEPNLPTDTAAQKAVKKTLHLAVLDRIRKTNVERNLSAEGAA